MKRITHKGCNGTVILDETGTYRCRRCNFISKESKYFDIKEYTFKKLMTHTKMWLVYMLLGLFNDLKELVRSLFKSTGIALLMILIAFLTFLLSNNKLYPLLFVILTLVYVIIRDVSTGEYVGFYRRTKGIPTKRFTKKIKEKYRKEDIKK